MQDAPDRVSACQQELVDKPLRGVYARHIFIICLTVVIYAKDAPWHSVSAGLRTRAILKLQNKRSSLRRRYRISHMDGCYAIVHDVQQLGRRREARRIAHYERGGWDSSSINRHHHIAPLFSVKASALRLLPLSPAS
jgi:hypothetical protein